MGLLLGNPFFAVFKERWYHGFPPVILFFIPKKTPHSKKTPIFAHVSLKSIPNEGFRDNFLKK